MAVRPTASSVYSGARNVALPRLLVCSVAGLAALAHALTTPLAASAQRALRVEDFAVTLLVREDGSMSVEESIRYRFTGSWNGVVRDIPIVYRTPAGFEHRLEIDDIEVTNPEGSDYRYELSREGRNRRVKVWVPGAVDATHTVDFRYRVRNPLLFFDGEGDGFSSGYDELYWNVTGVDSDVPIDQASATVFLPDGVTGVEVRSYTGPYGSRSSHASTSEVASGYLIRTGLPLAPREGLTVDLAWDSGVVARPGIVGRAWRLLRYNWVLLLPFLSLLLMWNLWKRHGKDPSRLPIVTRYEPPEGMIPAEVGTLVDNKPDLRDITATLVDLAVRGFIRIEQREEGGFLGLGVDREYTFGLVKERSTWDDELTGFERELLVELFKCGYPPKNQVKTEQLDVNFYKSLPRLRGRLFGQMVAAGYYRARPDHVVAKYWGSALATVIGTLVLLVFAGASGLLGAGTTAILLGGIGTVIPPLVFAPLMSRRTGTGTRRLEQILGYEEFLERVDADRLERMVDTPEAFERALPYAMALGVEQRWARAFEDIYREPPDWYSGSDTGTFEILRFTRGLNLMSARTQAVMSSRPRPQSSSSGSGGGWGSSSFSGGFGGGGGTGGF
ncbi:MAG TPA: DUF2207 domain-containing protein [Longimicrobiales bacterium]|nr:DUF2207 domain-containing protein [Longimicrobiales bacterium]